MVLDRDLSQERGVNLETSEDLDRLRDLAKDQGEWNSLTDRVMKAGEAEESNDDSAGRQK